MPSKDTEIVTVIWGDHNSTDSLYGSRLVFAADDSITLTNPLMPSGLVLQEWYAFTSYQQVRDTPDLPLLHHGKRYRVAMDMQPTPADTVVVEIQYFDDYSAPIRQQVLHGPDFAFDYPDDCHSYSIRLINGGCDGLAFRNLTLLEVVGNPSDVAGSRDKGGDA
jgi:accessory secretory protein Asp3